MPAQSTIDKALSALDGMATIVRNDMLVVGEYMTSDVAVPEMKGSLCGGRKFCAIGSLWVGYGVKVKRNEFKEFFLPGVEKHDRDDFVNHRPGLKLALTKLNEVAQEQADANDYCLEPISNDAIENLFEGSYGYEGLDDKALLKIIAEAKKRVKAAA